MNSKPSNAASGQITSRPSLPRLCERVYGGMKSVSHLPRPPPRSIWTSCKAVHGAGTTLGIWCYSPAFSTEMRDQRPEVTHPLGIGSKTSTIAHWQRLHFERPFANHVIDLRPIATVFDGSNGVVGTSRSTVNVQAPDLLFNPNILHKPLEGLQRAEMMMWREAQRERDRDPSPTLSQTRRLTQLSASSELPGTLNKLSGIHPYGWILERAANCCRITWWVGSAK